MVHFCHSSLTTKPYTPNSGHPRSTVYDATQARFLTGPGKAQEIIDLAKGLKCGSILFDE